MPPPPPFPPPRTAQDADSGSFRIDFISSKLSHSQAQNQERFENSRNNAKYIRPQNPRGGKLSNLSIRTQHDIEQHSFVLLEPPTASVRKSATKTVETTCKRAHQDV